VIGLNFGSRLGQFDVMNHSIQWIALGFKCISAKMIGFTEVLWTPHSDAPNCRGLLALPRDEVDWFRLFVCQILDMHHSDHGFGNATKLLE